MQNILSTLQQADCLLQQVVGELRLADTTEAVPSPFATNLFIAVLSLERQLDSILERHFAAG